MHVYIYIYIERERERDARRLSAVSVGYNTWAHDVKMRVPWLTDISDENGNLIYETSH